MIMAMGRDVTEQAAPDLFSTDELRDTSPAPTKPIAATEAAADTSTQRHVLPKNLSHAVTQLSDTELDQLCKAAFDEAKRRRRFRWSIGTDSTPSSRRPSDLETKRSSNKSRQADIAQVPLTRGQVNAVRAAFRAEIPPCGGGGRTGPNFQMENRPVGMGHKLPRLKSGVPAGGFRHGSIRRSMWGGCGTFGNRPDLTACLCQPSRLSSACARTLSNGGIFSSDTFGRRSILRFSPCK